MRVPDTDAGLRRALAFAGEEHLGQLLPRLTEVRPRDFPQARPCAGLFLFSPALYGSTSAVVVQR